MDAKKGMMCAVGVLATGFIVLGIRLDDAAWILNGLILYVALAMWLYGQNMSKH